MHEELITIAQRCYEREVTSTERDAHSRTVRRRIDYHLLPQLRQTASSGDETLQRLNAALDKFGYARSKVQRQLHHAFLNAVTPFIYGDELQLCSDRVLAENDWSDWRLQTLALTPRRFGKTTAVSMFCAACCLCVPEFQIAVFSTGRRASQMLLEQVLAMIRRYSENVPSCACKVIKSNMESVWIRGEGGGDDIRKVGGGPIGCVIFFTGLQISSYPGKASRCVRVRGWVGEAKLVVYMCVLGVRVGHMQTTLAGVFYLAGSVLFLVDGAKNNDMLGLGGGILFTLGSLLFISDRRE